MRSLGSIACAALALWSSSAIAEYRIIRDFGGPIAEYKLKYAALRDRGDRVIIDGVCNSACTLVLGMIPHDRICATPRASLGFHMAYYEPSTPDGAKVVSYVGTADFMAHYPDSVKAWLQRQGGLTPQAKKLSSGPELWAIVDRCPEELFVSSVAE
jgi:hypothetical protein